MDDKGPLLPQQGRVPLVSAGQEPGAGDSRTVATRDAELIRRWAARRQATPATGEDSPSGRGTSPEVKDGGAGIRFNFPGVSRFRDISWEEWFENFDRHDLTFVYEDVTSDGTLSNRYRLIHVAEWDGQFRSPQ
jgi:hypothetical protein